MFAVTITSTIHTQYRFAYFFRERWNKPTQPMNSLNDPPLPERIESEEQLDELMTRPRDGLVEFIKTLPSPLLILGASGKMGPTLVELARRAAEAAGHDLQIISVSRFSDSETRRWFEARGIRTIACDLLERDSLKDLPDAPNLIYLVGLKFGTGQNPSPTWAVNTIVPTLVSERFPHARIAALSTGNVYPLMPIGSHGAVESDALTPLGEYANAAVARERLFEFHSQKNGTLIVLLRLNYAVDLRYGVLVDLAQKVWAGAPVDVTMGYLNCIWQGDANDMIIRSLALARNPPAALNLTGNKVLSVRKLAERFGELMEKNVYLVGSEAETALLSDSSRACRELGEPATPLDNILRWTADWIMQGRLTLNKPTHFEVRDGKY